MSVCRLIKTPKPDPSMGDDPFQGTLQCGVGVSKPGKPGRRDGPAKPRKASSPVGFA
ncbi:hypothetical protein VTH82DRAFT_5988 [Thermothelomyces myriococcoides]